MKKKILLGTIGTMAIPGLVALSCGKQGGESIDKIRNDTKTVISSIKPTKILVNGAIVPIAEKAAYEAAIKTAHEAIDDAKNASEVAKALTSNKLLVEKAKNDYDNAIEENSNKFVVNSFKTDAKTDISSIKPTKILDKRAIAPTTEKDAYEAAIEAANKAIDNVKTSDEIKSIFNNNKLLVEKAKADYDNAIKVANDIATELVKTKKTNKDIISNIKPTKILVNGAILPITEKSAYEAAIKAANKAIDNVKTSDEIKSVFNNNKLLVEKAKADYDNAIKVANDIATELVKTKKTNKDIISNIKPTKILVNGAILPITEKSAYEATIKAAYKAIDQAKTSDEIKSVFNSNKSLVEKAKADYDNAIENSNKFIVVMSDDVAKENMTFDEGTKTLTIGKRVKSIKYNISSIWGNISEIKFSNPENIENIGINAFKSSELTTLDLSDLTNLENIGDYAFLKSSLTTLDLSGLINLKSIGEGAFHRSNLTTLNLSDLTNLKSIGNRAFSSSKLTTLNLSDLTNLKSIGNGAFSSSKLTTLNLSDLTNLKSIEESAFESSNLKTLNLSGLINLKSIGDGAFESSNLKTLDLSDLTNLESIGIMAFRNSKLTTIDLSGLTNLKRIRSLAFESSNLTTLNLSGLTNLESIGHDAFSGSNLTTLDLSGLINLKSIGFGAFESSNLKTLDLSDLTNLESIESDAFNDSKLTTLNLSGLTNLKSIGDGAFKSSELTTLNLSSLTNLKSIGNEAFHRSNLTTLDLSDLNNLWYIGNYAFSSSNLTTLNLSGLTNLKRIGTEAFYGSSKNLKIKVNKELWNKIMGKATRWQEATFDNFSLGENILGTDTSSMTRIDE